MLLLVDLAMVTDFTRLLHLPFNQQGCAHVAITIATALRAFIAQALRRIQNPLARQGVQYGA